MVYSPIWKDTVYQCSATGSTTSFSYTIKDGGGNDIFNGKAYAAPLAPTIDVNINRICQNYLNNNLPKDLNLNDITNLTYTSTTAYTTFYLYSGGTLLESYGFLYDWDYAHNWSGGNETISTPINSKYAPNMLSVSSFVSSNGVVNTWSRVTGAYCGKYAIYYLCRRGGWCSFLFEGKAEETDNIERLSTEGSSLNTTIQFGTKQFLNTVTKTFSLSTGWLSDTESDNFATNVLASPTVYLHNLDTNKIFPVSITDGSAVHKTYRNEKTLVCYTITAEASNKQSYVG